MRNLFTRSFQQYISSQNNNMTSTVSPSRSSALTAPLTPRSRNNNSLTPGRRAAISEAFDAVKLDDEAALYHAFNKSANNDPSVSNTFDCNAREPRNIKNTSLLHWAAYLGSEACFEVLLSFSNINVDTEESDGKVPLHYAAFQGNADMVRALEEKGADMVKSDRLGQTPCHLARMNGREQVAKLFPNYQQVVDQDHQKEVQSDVNFVPGNDGTDVLESFASPPQNHFHNHHQSSSPSPSRRNLTTTTTMMNQTDASVDTSNNSPHLFGRHHNNNTNNGKPLVNPNSFNQNQHQGVASPSSPNEESFFKSPQLKPRREEVRRSASSNNNDNNNNKDSFAAMISSPFQQQQENHHEQQEFDEQQQLDPALRENSEELRQLAADEANLEAMEREIELEETAQRVAQAQVAWLEGVKPIAQQQNSLSDNQLSERLWELCTAIESQFFIGPQNNNGNNNAGASNDEKAMMANSERNEIERKASQQLRTVTINLERQLLEKRSKTRQIPLVSFRWTSSSYDALMKNVNNNNKPQFNTPSNSILSPMSNVTASSVSNSAMKPNNGNSHHHHGRQQLPLQQPFRSVKVVSSNSRAASQISSIEPEPQDPSYHHHHHQQQPAVTTSAWKKPPPKAMR